VDGGRISVFINLDVKHKSDIFLQNFGGSVPNYVVLQPG
jgi:hypothetical protein